MTEPQGPEPQGLPLVLSDGADGRALGYAEGVLHVVCARAHPPGQPMSVTLRPPAGAELALSGKSASSKRRDDGDFDVRLRLHSVRREQRAELERLFS